MKSPEEQPVLLRVVVGSQAHGLARPDSDHDYREVFVIPTSEMLSLGRGRMRFAWQTDNKFTDDEGGYEIAEWLHLLSNGAPNAVEMCFASHDPEWNAEPLRPDFNVFPTEVQQRGRLLLARDRVQAGIIGYAMNSFRKIPEKPGKWKAGMLRVLYQGLTLIETGSTSLAVPTVGWGETVRQAAANEMTDGEALDVAHTLIAQIEAADSPLPPKITPDQWAAVNDWLLTLRREVWS